MEEENHSAELVDFRWNFIFNGSRDSILSSALCPKNGHSLDRALAKQINVRGSELDSLLTSNISVIVRNSNPEECEEKSSQSGQTNSDNQLSQLYRHPVIVKSGQKPGGVERELSAIRNHSLAPTSIPWSPTTRTLSDSVFESQTLPRGTFLELLSNSDTAPLFTFSPTLWTTT